ncbi:unnamed protein product [Schistosoma margrebowiei]|uniref:Uncharacterized protein n=1 Tax=Schistosoma margrebowiei TaxID=48269 RepID=A0A183MTV2_9TREM|nr:unnamed protein product [Schistosoma margrebowiei]
MSDREPSVSPCIFAIRVVNVLPFAKSVTEGDIVWKKAVGDTVNVDDLVAEIETDKTNVPVPAPCLGVITQFLVEDGGKVTADEDIFKIEEGAVPTSTVSERLPQETAKKQAEEKPLVSPRALSSVSPPPEIAQSLATTSSLSPSLDSARAE